MVFSFFFFQVVNVFPEVWFEIFEPCWEVPKIILKFLIYYSTAMRFSRRENKTLLWDLIESCLNKLDFSCAYLWLMASLLLTQHCPVDSISVARFQQSQMISAWDGKEKHIGMKKTTWINMFWQPWCSALRSIQGLAQGLAVVTMAGISGDPLQNCCYRDWNRQPFLFRAYSPHMEVGFGKLNHSP